MRARILGAAAAICLLPVASSAQDGLRSASLPERSLMSPSPALGDLFRAEPDTYTPRRDLPNIYALPIVVLRSDWSLGDVYYMSPPPYSNLPCAGVVRGCPVSSYDAGDRRDRHHARRRGYVGRVPRSGPGDPPPPTAAPPVAPPPIAAPGPAKTFYVIAGCYAGDTPPRTEWIPPDCDLSRVRVIPP